MQCSYSEGQAEFLGEMLAKERRVCRERPSTLPKGPGLVSADERRWAVAELSRVEKAEGWGWDVFACAVSILDRVLVATKVPSKYLTCLALTAAHLSLKLNLEAERVPRRCDLIRAAGSRVSESELERMERAVVEALDWELRGPSVGRFLHLLGGLSRTSGLLSASSSLDLGRSLPAALGDSALLASLRPSVVALGLLSLHLEAAGVPHWLGVVAGLQAAVGAEAGDVIAVRESVAALLAKRKLSIGESDEAERKRRRKPSGRAAAAGVERSRTPPECLCIDDIADSLLSPFFQPLSPSLLESC